MPICGTISVRLGCGRTRRYKYNTSHPSFIRIRRDRSWYSQLSDNYCAGTSQRRRFVYLYYADAVISTEPVHP